jgi:hypothetical protein
MMVSKGARTPDESNDDLRADLRPRATRLPLRVPVIYRDGDHESWRHAWTVNVSRSGVLLEFEPMAEDSLAAQVEFVMGLSSGRELIGMHNVRCHGRVVRSERAARTRRMAITIDQYQYAAADQVFGGAAPFSLD